MTIFSIHNKHPGRVLFLAYPSFDSYSLETSHLLTKPTKWLCAQQRLRSAWASTQSDQCLRCALNGELRIQAFFMRTMKTLIRLGRCTGWSESLQGTHAIMLVLLWGSPNVKCHKILVFLNPKWKTTFPSCRNCPLVCKKVLSILII